MVVVVLVDNETSSNIVEIMDPLTFNKLYDFQLGIYVTWDSKSQFITYKKYLFFQILRYVSD